MAWQAAQMHRVQSSLWSDGLESKGLALCIKAVISNFLWKDDAHMLILDYEMLLQRL